MKTLQELDLHVPHLGVKQTCQTIGGGNWFGSFWEDLWGNEKRRSHRHCYEERDTDDRGLGDGGGYGWDEGDHGNYNRYHSDDGDIDPAYKVTNRPNEDDTSWHDDPDPYDDRDDDRDNYGDWNCSDSGGSGGSGGSSGSDGKDDSYHYDGSYGENGYYMDPYMSANDAKIIYAAMEDLPEALQNQEVKIVVNPDLLASFDPYANACYLREGATITTTDGRKITITEDTILLKSADVGDLALLEESVHLWAYNNGCCKDGKISNSNREYMERQADLIEAIHAREKGTRWTSITGNISRDKEIQNYVDDFVKTHNLNNLIDSLEDSNKYMNSDTWDYKWEELLKDCYPQYDCDDESPDTSSWLDLEDEYDRPIDDHVLDNHFQSGSRLIKARR